MNIVRKDTITCFRFDNVKRIAGILLVLVRNYSLAWPSFFNFASIRRSLKSMICIATECHFGFVLRNNIVHTLLFLILHIYIRIGARIRSWRISYLKTFQWIFVSHRRMRIYVWFSLVIESRMSYGHPIEGAHEQYIGFTIRISRASRYSNFTR